MQSRTGLVFGLLLLAGAQGLWGQATVITVPTGNLNFAYQQGQSGMPLAQTIRLITTPTAQPFTATASTTSGGGWLFVNGVTQYTGNTGSMGQDLAISVSPAGLAPSPAPYSGNILINCNGSTVSIVVSLLVATTPQLVVNPSSLAFQTAEPNATFTIPLSLQSTNGTQLSYLATAELTNGTPAGLVTVAPNPGTTGGGVTIIVNTNGLNNALGTGVVRFTTLGTNNTVSFPFTIQASAPAQLQVAPTLLTFPYQPGGSTPPTAKTVSVTSSTQTQLGYSATITSGSSYFSLATDSQSGASSLTGLTTPTGFRVVPNVAALTPPLQPNYDATINITSSNNQTQQVTARILGTTQPLLTVSPDSLNFNYAPGGSIPVNQGLNVGSTGANQYYTAEAVFPSGTGAFFTVPGGQRITPSILPVSLNPNILATLPPNSTSFSGTVRLTSLDFPTAPPIEVPVRLTVGGAATILTADDPNPAPFEGVVGAPQTARTTTIRSADNSLQSFVTSVDYGSGAQTGWLVVSPSTAITPALITFNVDATRVTVPGTYTANIVLTPLNTAYGALRIPIRYNVTGAATVTAEPARFDLTQSGTTVPGQQSVQLSSTVAGLTYIATVGSPTGDPNFVTPVSQGSVPGTLTFTLNSQNLRPRADPYVNNIVLIFNQGVPNVTIPVSLKVNSSVTVTVSPTGPLNFTAAIGGSSPPAQTINVTSGGVALPFTAAATTTTGGNWLTVSPTSGTTTASGGAPTPLSVNVTPGTLTAGTYNGAVTITPTGGSPTTVNVVLTVSTANPPNGLTFTSNASGISRGVSPGELITIKGKNAAPSTPMTFTLQNNLVPTKLGEVRVLFDNVEAPLLYVGPAGDKSGDQINAIVPYSVSCHSSTNVVVEYKGLAAQAIPIAIRETEPGVYTANSAGSGPAALLNQNSSYNTQANPATPGSVVQIYGTGEGLVTPQPPTGGVTSGTAPFPQFLASNVQVRINGIPARVLFAGAAPGLVAGVFQINAEVPNSLSSLNGTQQVSLEVTIGSTSSQPGVTLFVRGNQ